MAFIPCPECGEPISGKALSCPKCGCMRGIQPAPWPRGRFWYGFEWKSRAEILGWPLVHIAFGRNRETGRLMVARGVIAIGQFGLGVVTIAQIGFGFLFGFGQLVSGLLAIGQVALGLFLGLGQMATGSTAIGQIALGQYVLAQAGWGEHVWSTKIKDPEAIAFFQQLWEQTRHFFGV